MNTAIHKRNQSSGIQPITQLSSHGNYLARTERRRKKRMLIRKYRHRRFVLFGTGLAVVFSLLMTILYIRSNRSTHPQRHHATYKHSDVMDRIGDKSYEYGELRRKYDALLPVNDTQRMRDFVSSLHKRTYHPLMKHEMTYDIYDCPLHPPPNYPYAWNIKDVLNNWPPDDPDPRLHIYQGVCVFDYERHRPHAKHYREAEVPYVIRNDPKVLRTTERWNQPTYLDQLLGNVRYRTEFSHNNHFMYWASAKKAPKGWKPPTKMLRMPYQEWLHHANVTDRSDIGPNKDHWYYRLIGCGHYRDGKCEKDSSEYLFDELAFFQPTEENDLYLVKPEKQAGIHCRFGMSGVIAENHFDGSRNMITLLGGERRYILAHPEQCPNFALYPKGHPSARHSAVDWSDPDWDQFPRFQYAEVNEVVMQAGDVLYLPTYWFHYIVSLDLNFQCNTRSGVNREYERIIDRCGF